MRNEPFRKVATHHPSTHPAVMVCSFLGIPVLLTYLLNKVPDESVESWQVLFVCSLFWLGAFYYAIKWIHSVHFSSDGLIFCRFGVEYRKLKWEQIIQVGVAKEYKATKLTLVFTPEGCPVFDGHSTTTMYVERFRRKLILIDATKANLAAIKELYGELDYEMSSSF